MIIGIDVDLTLVDTLTPWIEWYRFKTGHDLNHIFSDEIDLGFNLQDLMINHSSPLDYWKQSDLYDNLVPIDGAKEMINNIRELGHEIIFISYCFSGHLDSKVSFLKRNFGPDITFVDTKHKEFISMDVFIDDHSNFLEKVKERQPECKVIQKLTPINSRSLKADASFLNWNDLIL